MDLVIISVVAGLTRLVSSRSHVTSSSNNNNNNNNNKWLLLSTTTTALCCSLLLLGLGVLDACPPAWNCILQVEVPNNNNNSSREDEQGPEGQADAVSNNSSSSSRLGLSLVMAYRVVLWAIAALVVVVGPFAMGSQLFYKIFWSQLRGVLPQKQWLRLMYLLVSLPVQLIVKTVASWCCCCCCRKEKHATMMIPLHVAVSKTPAATSTRWSRGGGVVSSYWIIKLLGGLLGVLVMVFLLNLVGPVVIPRGTHHQTSTLAHVISSLTAIGILVSALLNGFGSVSLPFSCLGGLFLKPLHPDAVPRAEQELQKAQASLDRRLSEMKGTSNVSALSGNAASVSRTLSWGSRSQSYSDLLLGDSTQRRKQLGQEIEFLQTLVDELALDVAEMRDSAHAAAVARTPAGRLRSLIGMVFSVILLVRLGMVSLSIWTTRYAGPQRRHGDPVTMALLWLMGESTHVYYNALSQFTSLILTAVLSFTQVRSFCQTLRSLSRLFSKWYRRRQCQPVHQATPSATETANGFVLLPNAAASLLMMTYCLACSVLTKNMLPAEYRSSFSQALGGSEIFRVRLYMVNVVFLSSAVVSAAVLGMLLGIQRQNTHRYLRDMDDDVRLDP